MPSQYPIYESETANLIAHFSGKPALLAKNNRAQGAVKVLHRIANKCQIFSYHDRMGLVRRVNSSTALVVKGVKGIRTWRAA